MEEDIIRAFSDRDLRLRAVRYDEITLREVDVVVLATPTDYCADCDGFDTHSIESIIEMAASLDNPPLFVIKSTVPIGFTDKVSRAHPKIEIIYNPEFLRERNSILDSEQPSRIIIGISSSARETGLVSDYIKEIKKV